MALTKSLITQTVFGNMAVQCWDITPDAVATSFATTLRSISFCQVTAKSAFTDATFGVFTENEGPAGTAMAGNIAMTSIVDSGEIKYRVVAYGSRG